MSGMMYEEEAATANDALRATVRTLEAGAYTRPLSRST